jgi:CheY-like chemotaxis protein
MDGVRADRDANRADTERGAAMTNLKDEVAQAVYSMYEALTVFGDAKNLGTPVGRAATDFNNTLARAQAAFPFSETLRDIERVREDDAVVTLLSRLAILKGAFDAQLMRRARWPPREGAPKIVRLPLASWHRATPPELAAAQPFEYDLPDLSGVNVLLAEHTVSLRELLRIGLAQCGAVVELAGSLPAALGQLQARRPHIVVFDVRLEECGVPLAAAAQTRGVPAIALAARDIDANLQVLLGAYEVRLLRTFDQVTVASAIKNAVAES